MSNQPKTNGEIHVLRGKLERMGAGRKAPADGRGCYLGDGSAFVEPIRSGDLSKLLTELLAWRTQCSDFTYDEETGNILYTYPDGDLPILPELKPKGESV